jgi:hypothetical protein
MSKTTKQIIGEGLGNAVRAKLSGEKHATPEQLVDGIREAFINFTTGDGENCPYLVDRQAQFNVDQSVAQMFVKIDDITYRVAIDEVSGAVEQEVEGDGDDSQGELR